MSYDAAFVAIAIHHVAPEYSDAMLAFMRRVLAVPEGADGLVEFRAWFAAQRYAT